MKNFIKKFYPKSFFTQWVVFFIPPAFAVLVASTYYYHFEQEKSLLAISTHETAIVNIGAHSIEESLEPLKSDLAYISQHHGFRMYVNNMSYPSNHDFYEDYILLMQSRSLYDQIRWIDETGYERVRFDWKEGHPILVPKEALQNKANRYYFTETASLPVNTLYFSPFDLNIENDKIELPYKPMIRIATPVSDSHGVKRGIIIINYLASRLIDKFTLAMSMSSGESMFLNKDGYWLKGAKKTDEWGFMFKRNDLTLKHAHPSVWQRMIKEEHGQFENKEGLWTFRTLYPLSNRVSGHQSSIFKEETLKTKEYRWYILTFIPSEKLYSRSNDQLDFLLVVTVIALVFSGIGSWLIVFLHRKDKRGEEKVRKLSAIAEQINDHVMVTERDGTITYVNPAFLEHTGFCMDEVIGQTPRILKSGRYTEEFYQKLWKKVLRGDVYRGTLINKKKNGDIYYESQTITPLRDEMSHIIGFVSTGKDVTKESLLNQELEHFATIDALTGLYNRHKFEELFILEEERTRRFSYPLSLILVDIDYFKEVNDQYGHNMGDEVLKTLACIVEKKTRKIDIVARWGGEEFLVLSPNTSFENMQELAEKLRLAVEHTVFPNNIFITISLGVSTFEAEDTFAEMFRRADQGLYYAKEHGRNQVGSV